MKTVAVIGLQWGDEGKGKIVDLLSQEAEVVVRSQGGNNAGHSVISEGVNYHFHLIPSGILNPKALCFIGGGVVVDPSSLLKEMDQLTEKNIFFENRLEISPYAHVIFPYHLLLDQLAEKEKGKLAVGTTGRGIGPCYSDKIQRLGIRMGELVHPETLKEKLKTILPIKNRLLQNIYRHSPLSFDLIYQNYLEYAKKLKNFVKPIEQKLFQALHDNKKILFEGAQGALLDVDYGTYPYVTSSHTTSGGAAIGAGVGPKSICQVIGVMKAYTSRVGNGPFPTEFESHESFIDPIKAKEFGTTTGRKRRLGWFDAVLVSHAIRLNGVDSIALTRLDILDHLPKIRICKGYYLDHQEIDCLPLNWEDLKRVKPIYEECEGWQVSTKEMKHLEELPKNSRLFLSKLESLLNISIDIISYGPEREKTWQQKIFF